MIVRPVFRASYAELLHAPVRMGLLALFSLLPIAGGVMHRAPPTSNHGIWFGLILGAGLIGRPLSNGTLALLFTRPLRRADYVVTRWLAATSAAGLCTVVLQLLLAWEQALRFGQLDLGAVAIATAEDLLAAAGVISVLVFLSSLVGSIGDAGLLLVLLVAGSVIRSLGSFFSKPGLTWFGTRLEDFVTPSLELVTTFGSSPPSWYAVAAYLSTVVICLAVAVELVRRKEISYVSGGD